MNPYAKTFILASILAITGAAIVQFLGVCPLAVAFIVLSVIAILIGPALF